MTENHNAQFHPTCEIIKCFKNRLLVPGRVIILARYGRNPRFFGLFYLKSYDDEIWYVGTLYDLEYEYTNRISIFGRKPVLWAQNPFFEFFGLFKD